jgi:hypothetical protein
MAANAARAIVPPMWGLFKRKRKALPPADTETVGQDTLARLVRNAMLLRAQGDLHTVGARYQHARKSGVRKRSLPFTGISQLERSYIAVATCERLGRTSQRPRDHPQLPA